MAGGDLHISLGLLLAARARSAIAFVISDRIKDLIEISRFLAVLGLFVTQRGEAARTPMNDTMAAVDESTLVQLDERFAHGSRQLRRQRVGRPVPVGRASDRS